MTNDQLEIDVVKILVSSEIPPSTIRIEILKAVLSYKNQEFTFADIHHKIKKGKIFIGFSPILTTIVLFKAKGIVVKTTNDSPKQYGKHGRPVAKLCLSKDSSDFIIP